MLHGIAAGGGYADPGNKWRDAQVLPNQNGFGPLSDYYIGCSNTLHNPRRKSAEMKRISNSADDRLAETGAYAHIHREIFGQGAYGLVTKEQVHDMLARVHHPVFFRWILGAKEQHGDTPFWRTLELLC